MTMVFGGFPLLSERILVRRTLYCSVIGDLGSKYAMIRESTFDVPIFLTTTRSYSWIFAILSILCKRSSAAFLSAFVIFPIFYDFLSYLAETSTEADFSFSTV